MVLASTCKKPDRELFVDDKGSSLMITIRKSEERGQVILDGLIASILFPLAIIMILKIWDLEILELLTMIE